MAAFGALYYVGTDNLGDEIQSLAAIAHLPKVDRYLNRDSLHEAGALLSRQTSVIMNGWWCQRPENWPPAPQIRPLAVSMHITQERVDSALGLIPSEFLLTPPISRYLKSLEPIGARDVTTARLLQDAGIDSYFSGCLTLTLKRPAVQKAEDLIVLNDLPRDVVQYIRVRTKKPIFSTSHIGYRESGRVERFHRARELLALYARASCVVTGRLHCALPCLAMGVPVLLINVAADQYRFAGLNDFVHHCSAEDFISGRSNYDVNDPPENMTRHVPFRDALLGRVAEFIATADSDTREVWAAGDTDRTAAVIEVYRRKELPTPMWQAANDTFVKASAGHSASLSDKEKVRARAGSLLSGLVSGKADRHLALENTALNGRLLPQQTWHIFEDHWKAL